MTPRLGVNIDHIATLREVRHTPYPNLLEAALLAEEAGADQITVHLREDRRHIQDHDLPLLRSRIRTKLNLEIAPVEEMVRIALNIRPDQVTLVPERREELTTEGGLALESQYPHLKRLLSHFREEEIPVSLFIDADLEMVRKTAELRATAFEIHTGAYAEAEEALVRKHHLMEIESAAKLGKSLGLQVFAGHGLHLENIDPLLQIQEIEEYNIGHSIVARSVFVGVQQAVFEMKSRFKNRDAINSLP